MAVADHGTFSAAADVLDTVQSNVSTHIARLEKELGTILIDRATANLTAEGEAVVRRSRRISAEMDNISADVAAFKNEIMGEVGFGMIQTTAQWLLPHLLTRMTNEFPDTSLKVFEGTTSTLEPQISQGSLDLAIIQSPHRHPDVIAEELFEEDFVLIAPKGHEITKQKKLTIVDLQGLPLLLPSLGTAPRYELDSLARKAGVKLEAKAEIDAVELTVSLVAMGHGPALVPVTGVPDEFSEFEIVSVADLPTRRVALAQHRRVPATAPVRAIRGLIIDIVASQSENRNGLRLVNGRSK